MPRLPIIMFSTLTERGASATLEALTRGASDYVTKPSNVGSMADGLIAVRDQLVPKVKALCGRAVPTGVSAKTTRSAARNAARAIDSQTAPPAERPTPRPTAQLKRVSLLVIGTSTGGPAALASLWADLPQNCPVPVLIVQHMPPMFTRLLAERLTKFATVPVEEGIDGQIVAPGQAWIAPGDFHMELARSAAGEKLHIHQGPQENSCRPSVEPMFRSAAALHGGGVLAVMLTGMGYDGLDGARQISQAGGQVIVQDEATSVVWGMPGAVADAGLANAVLPLDRIAHEIRTRLNFKRPLATSSRSDTASSPKERP
jgi:two-component system chemotaxis response regulator CheB